MIVYLILNTVNCKGYVGKHKGNSISSRWNENLDGGNNHLEASKKKYGLKAFSREILGYVTTKEEMDMLERLWIVSLRTYDSEFGYNQTYGGDGTTFVTKETRDRMSKSAKASCTPERREYLRQLGLNIPQEQRDRIRKAVMAHVSQPDFSAEHSKRVKAGLAVNPLPKEFYVEQGKKRIGQKRSNATRQRMRVSRAKQTNIARGWKKDPAAVAKTVAAVNLWYATASPEEKQAKIDKQRATLLATNERKRTEKLIKEGKVG